MAKSSHDTPAMRQFRRFKDQYPDCVLFFRMGDFYEMFYDDARLAHKVLGVTLTQRTAGIPMAGVPYHAVEGYLRRMIQAGYRVAVCDQVEDPATAKGVVARDVTRLITPGTLTDDSLLEEGAENPLAAIYVDGDQAAVAWAELSTGGFAIATFKTSELADELARIAPCELLWPGDDAAPAHQQPELIQQLTAKLGCVATCRPPWQFRAADAVETLKRQFQVAGLSGFGLDENDLAIRPAAAVVEYLIETQRGDRIAHLQPPRRFERHHHLVIDQVSLRSLEVDKTMRSGQAAGSLLGVMQDCVTAMGKRTLRQWLCYPLCQREPIEQRQRVVGLLKDDHQLRDALREALDQVQDVQRIIARMAVNRALPRDVVGLGLSVKQAQAISSLLDGVDALLPYHQQLGQLTGALSQLAEQILQACVDQPPAHLRDGGLIRDGHDQQLDEYRSLQRDSNAWLVQYQKQLIEQTGITSLKVGYNKVFGYYIEVSAVNAGKAPDHWSRKQTLKNAERYITPELKTYEEKVLTASQKAIAREQAIFEQLCTEAQRHLSCLQQFAAVVAQLDVLACLARRAERFGYVRPMIVDEPVLHITAGRHPVLDELLGDQFVPNDVALGLFPAIDPENDRDTANDPRAADSQPPIHPPSEIRHPPSTLALITGPNMAGKSTYIRQTALITLLAHTGSFVPAESAIVGLCDRIFTRIGASDELHAGQSTFMVEMTETANICHHATDRSLVILDEIGRGTSTLDGLSLAWAIAEHLAQRRCRTLFATHYHEITELARQYDHVANLNVTVREWQDEIVFLHRIVPGATDRSYGIHVAKIAGLPTNVVKRANELMAQLEVSHTPAMDLPPGHIATKQATPPAAALPARDGQLALFTEYIEHPVIQQLRQVDLNQLTPMQAFDLLRQLCQEVRRQA